LRRCAAGRADRDLFQAIRLAGRPRTRRHGNGCRAGPAGWA